MREGMGGYLGSSGARRGAIADAAFDRRRIRDKILDSEQKAKEEAWDRDVKKFGLESARKMWKERKLSFPFMYE